MKTNNHPLPVKKSNPEFDYSPSPLSANPTPSRLSGGFISRTLASLVEETGRCEWEEVSGDGGVLLKRGRAPPSLSTRVLPEDGDRLMIHYVGTRGGIEFDRNHGGYPFEFTLGGGSVIKGWDVAFRVLAVGESAELTIGPSYGYGDEGSPGATKAETIPPGATLNFFVEFVGIKEGLKSTRAQDDRERLLELRKEREQAAATAKEAKAAKAAKAVDAKAKLAAKLANKGKKGKGGGGGYNGKKEKAPKPDKKIKNGKVKKGDQALLVALTETEATAQTEEIPAPADDAAHDSPEEVADSEDDWNVSIADAIAEVADGADS